MNTLFRNGLMMLAAGAFAASCADYNETNNFYAEPDPAYVEPYKDLAPVKSYIDRAKYPNMTLGATLKVADFNRQELAHAAVVNNCDNVSFGTTLMSGAIVNEKGVMNFLSMSDLLAHVEEIGYDVYGSPIVANANQADAWLQTLTAPIEIQVDAIEDKFVDYTTMESFSGSSNGTKPVIEKKFDGDDNALKIPKSRKGWVNIVEDFDIDSLGKYTITFYAQITKGESESIICTFADNKIMENEDNPKKFTIKSGGWKKIVLEDIKAASGAQEGYVKLEGNANYDIYIKSVKVVHNPDNHRPQTEKEKSDTIQYALNEWCDGLMKINAGRIQLFDLIDEPIDSKAVLENGMYDLKHSTTSIYWQDILGSENYAPVVSKVASSAYEKYSGDPAKLKFFISETGLEDQNKFESLMYWIKIWDNKSAKIDGINAKVSLVYSEDATTQAANKATVDKLLENLASTGKLIRISNFDIKYQNADGASVSADKITAEQRQNLADYYAYVIKSYMSKIPNEKQAGICKGNLADTNDPVGLWAVDVKSKDWVRTATYKAFCDALSGK